MRWGKLQEVKEADEKDPLLVDVIAPETVPTSMVSEGGYLQVCR
jgi:hypothetical protein